VCTSCDQAKRQSTFDEWEFDFEDAPTVFFGLTLELEDSRRDYDETRMICFGHLAGRLIVIGYRPRGAVRHISA